MVFWDKDHSLILLTVEEFKELPDGTEVTSINGDIRLKGVDKIDLDTRMGHVAWGLIVKKESE